MALIVLLVPYPQSGNQGTDPDSGGAKVVDFVDFQHRVDFAGMGEDVRYLVGGHRIQSAAEGVELD